jgi:hypothetical protein
MTDVFTKVKYIAGSTAKALRQMSVKTEDKPDFDCYFSPPVSQRCRHDMILPQGQSFEGGRFDAAANDSRVR